MNINQPIYAQLRAERKRQKLTQAELAERAHMKQSDVSLLERGKDIRLSTLSRVVLALDLSFIVMPKLEAAHLSVHERLSEQTDEEAAPILKRFEVFDDE
jgi:transcriptional regulator with XRE-family HTH domain